MARPVSLNLTKMLILRNSSKKDAERRITTKGKSKDAVKVFSFRSWTDEVEEWRLYAHVKGMKVDELGAAAMDEYIKRHPLTEGEKQLLKAVQRVEDMKSRNQNT